MQLYLIAFLMYFGTIHSDSLDITPMAQVGVGDNDNEVNADREQEGLYFAVDESEQFWLVDAIHRQIKAFNNKGRLMYIVLPENPSVRIDKIYVSGNYLITLSSEGILYFYNKYNGKLLGQSKLAVEEAYFNKAYFYGNILFLPQRGHPAPNENLYEFAIEIKEIPEQPVQFNVRQINFITQAWDLWDATNNNFLPFDSSCYSLLKGLNHLSLRGQSRDFILIMRLVGKVGKEDGYYLFLKKEKILKKIGIIPKSITGLISQTWWGEGAVFVGRNLYLMGVKYKDMKYFDSPQSVIISKIDLSKVDKLPTVPIEEIMRK